MVNNKSISPVLSAIILAATMIALGIVILMWISGYSTMVIKQSQIDLLRSEQAAKENLVIVHATYNSSGSKVLIYLLNMGFDIVFLGPIRIIELQTANSTIFTPEGIWFNNYTAKAVVNSVEEEIPALTMSIGDASEYLENLEIRNPSAITDKIKVYALEPCNEINGFYKVEMPAELSLNTAYRVEVWTVVNIYGKAYLCKLYTTQLTT